MKYDKYIVIEKTFIKMVKFVKNCMQIINY